MKKTFQINDGYEDLFQAYRLYFEATDTKLNKIGAILFFVYILGMNLKFGFTLVFWIIVVWLLIMVFRKDWIARGLAFFFYHFDKKFAGNSTIEFDEDYFSSKSRLGTFKKKWGDIKYKHTDDFILLYGNSRIPLVIILIPIPKRYFTSNEWTSLVSLVEENTESSHLTKQKRKLSFHFSVAFLVLLFEFSLLLLYMFLTQDIGFGLDPEMQSISYYIFTTLLTPILIVGLIYWSKITQKRLLKLQGLLGIIIILIFGAFVFLNLE